MNETIRTAGACDADAADRDDEAERRGEAVGGRGRGDRDDQVRRVAERVGLQPLVPGRGRTRGGDRSVLDR